MKSKRHEKILKLIEENVIVTQDELQDLLLKLGFNVTQSTVSRDIKELRIIKAQDINGVYRYMTTVGKQLSVNDKSKDHFTDIFAKSVIDVKYALNNIVIKCYTGMASSACVAFDTLYSSEILGSLAGDDTIIVVTKSEADSKSLAAQLLNLI
ncbi:MAG: arginine repressor, partial [Clostridia bacterium]|nr:arginine repressor [Clostridia bacterium]